MEHVVTAGDLQPGMVMINGSINIWDKVTSQEPETVMKVRRTVHGYVAIDFGHTAVMDEDEDDPVSIWTEVAPWSRFTIEAWPGAGI